MQPPCSRNHPTLLVVDDERLTLAIIGRLLEQNGYRVLLSSTGVEAIELLRRERIDLVLLDVIMPNMDGWQVLSKIREKRNATELPVIMFTATEDRHEVVRMFQSGANDYISKPFDTDITIARVATQLRFKLAQDKLRLSEERYALASRATKDGLWDWDFVSNRIYYSPRWFEILDIPESDGLDQPEVWFDRIHCDDMDRVQEPLARIVEGHFDQFDAELRMRTQEGHFRWVICRGVAVRSKNGSVERLAGSMTDISGGKVADVLTGLPNRLLFTERVARRIHFQETVKTRGSVASSNSAVLYLDLDNFKYINDTFGHVAGDQVLQVVARRLERVVEKENAIAARFGGDEFALLIEDALHVDEILRIAERIHEQMKAPILLIGGREVFTQTSVGVALIDANVAAVDHVLSRADMAMYDAKSRGKGCTSLFDQSMHDRSENRLQLETELRKAVANKEFYLVYQPIVDLDQGRLVGFEALIRWEHSELGNIPPSLFIPLTEELNLIQSLGQWLIEKVCSQLQQWRIRFPRSCELFVSINISGKQFEQAGFVETLLQTTQGFGVPGESIKLEITESVIMENIDAAVDMFRLLQSFGFRIAIDDFGTGFSSLSYLHRLPLDDLKIDKSFIDRIEDPKSGKAIVKTILSLSQNLNLSSIAEGVETQNQVEQLKALGCGFAQGYFYSKPLIAPLASELVERFFANQNGYHAFPISDSNRLQQAIC